MKKVRRNRQPSRPLGNIDSKENLPLWTISQQLKPQSTPQCTIQPRRKPRHLRQIMQQDITNLTKEYINSGQMVMINVLGESDKDIVQAVSPKQMFQRKISGQLIQAETEPLSGYLENQQMLRNAQNKIRQAIFKTNKKPHSVKSHRVVFGYESSFESSRDSLTNKANKNICLEMYKRQRRLTQLSQEKDEQLARWMSNYNRYRRSQPARPELEQRRNSIKLQNTDKYNLPFVDYLRKKSSRRIQRDLLDKIMSRRESIVEQYQQKMLKEMTGLSKQQPNLRKCFEQINQQTRHLFCQ